jgi:hypothetical protein
MPERFNDQNAFASFIDHVSGTNAFNNTGTYNKQANTVTSVEAVFNNTGTVNVNAGTMLFQGTSSTSSTGVFNIANGATLEFRNGSHTLDHPTIQGAGTFAVTTDNVGADAVVTLNGGTLTAPFLFSGSTLTGTDRTFQGPATWTGGAFSGTAVTTFANDVTISGSNVKLLGGGGTINLEKTTTWSGNTANNNGQIQFASGGTINNHGTFNDANAFDTFIEHNVGGPHNFNNIGTYNKLSNTITTVDIGVAFNNSGVVNVNAGSFRPSGGTSTGTFNIAAGAVLDFKNGNNVLNGVTNAGTRHARGQHRSGRRRRPRDHQRRNAYHAVRVQRQRTERRRPYVPGRRDVDRRDDQRRRDDDVRQRRDDLGRQHQGRRQRARSKP